jgi:hypothetical protein
MGDYVIGFDMLQHNLKYIDWSDPRLTKRTIGYLFISMIVSLISPIPLAYIALVLGCTVILHKTWVFALIRPILEFIVSGKLVWKINQKKRKITKKLKREVKCEVFENQRWWAGTLCKGSYFNHVGPGWLAKLNERGAWSDEQGLVEVPEISDDLPGPSWRWKDMQWELDREWMETDENGWVYTYSVLAINIIETTDGNLLHRIRQSCQLLDVESGLEACKNLFNLSHSILKKVLY